MIYCYSSLKQCARTVRLEADRPQLNHPSEKSVEFDFVATSSGTQRGNMHHVAFTVIDAN